MKSIAILMLLLGVGLGPAPAVASTNALPETQPLQQGVIEQIGADGTIRVNGISYVYSPTATVVFNRQGVVLKSPRLALGKTIAYTVQQGGSRPTLNQIWIIE